MAKTFKALAEIADWSGPSLPLPTEQEKNDEVDDLKKQNQNKPQIHSTTDIINPTLHYNIQIHLPETRDSSVMTRFSKV